MKTLVIYDNDGYIIQTMSGTPLPKEPIGVPFLWVEVPQGKRVKALGTIGVDVAVTPHVAILEDIPPTEIDTLKQQANDLNIAIANILGV